MKSGILLLLALLVVASPEVGHAATTLLDANFNNKPIGVPIGTGGASAGEPITVDNIVAITRGGCGGSNCLEITDTSYVSPLGGRVVFGHTLGNVDLDQGTISVEADIVVSGDTPPDLRFFNSLDWTLLRIVFDGTTNEVNVLDGMGYQAVTSYTPLSVMRIQIIMYNPWNFYELLIDGNLLIQANTFITSGTLATIKFIDYDGSNSDNTGTMYLDNLTITDLYDTYTGVPSGIPSFDLAAQPNPFRSSTTIRFSTTETAPVELKLYDVRGRLVRELSSGILTGGAHTETWDGRDSAGRPVAPGVYFTRLNTTGSTETKRITLVR